MGLRMGLRVAFLVVLLVCCQSGVYAAGIYGADVSSLVSKSSWQCLNRAWRSSNTWDPNAAATIANAHAAGIANVDVYLFPSPLHSAANATIDAFHKAVKSNGAKFNTTWIDVEGPMYWSTNQAQNTAYILDLHARLVSYGYRVGMYASHSGWLPITGNAKILCDLPVWYAHYQTPPQANFNDFKPFGCWSQPYIKQYRGTHSECGASIDANWRK